MNSQAFSSQLRLLFAAMSTGGWFGSEQILHFDGHLFENDQILELDSDGIRILREVSTLDWSSIEPSIFGTLFERSLDPSKRSQLGAHYTSKEDILLIVEPVLMAPLRRKWSDIQAQANALAKKREESPGQARQKIHGQISSLLSNFAFEIATTQVLDPACGSGNFLYVALRQLLDLWKEVANFAVTLDLSRMMPLPGSSPSPEQLHGIEINAYAHQLAQATIWIGYIQWLRENGYGYPAQPVLKPLDNIMKMDAILAFDDQGRPYEPEWPKADVIIGNPPFLGNKKMLSELGNHYVKTLRDLYVNRLPGGVDFVTYWFEKAREMIMSNKAHRAGLLATQSIRHGASQRVLERIKETGDIFWAQSDREWILDGAAVRVSMIGFDNGLLVNRELDGFLAGEINSNLSTAIDMGISRPLKENMGICFQGPVKVGPFDIDNEIASKILADTNPHNRSNYEVIRPIMNGHDITNRTRNRKIIDFGQMTEVEAALFEAPFEYLRKYVKPIREKNNDRQRRTFWWRLGRSGGDFKQACEGKKVIILTPRVAKHRIFVWASSETLPDSRVYAFTREDNYFFGVLHSRLHEIWSLATSSRHGVGNDPTYNSTTCFVTFPFPWSPGREPQDDPHLQAIAQAARELVELRDNWLNPPGLSEAELKKRTLTNLYNQRPTWLDLAHRKLDQAVFAAYGWPDDLSDENILERLLALNMERSKSHETVK